MNESTDETADAAAEAPGNGSADAEYVPSPSEWVRKQVEKYEGSGGTEGTAGPGTGIKKLIPDQGGSGAGQVAASTGTPWTAIALAVAAAIALACGVIAIVAPPAQRARRVRPLHQARLRRAADARHAPRSRPRA